MRNRYCPPPTLLSLSPPPVAAPNVSPPDSATNRPVSRPRTQGSLFSACPTTFFGSAALSTTSPFPAARGRATSDTPVFIFSGTSDFSVSDYTPSSTQFAFSATPGATPRPSRSPSPQPPTLPAGQPPLPFSPRRAASSSPVASSSSPGVSIDCNSRDALLSLSLSSISARHGTRSPRQRSPSLEVGIADLSIRTGPEEPQSPRGRSPSLGVDVSELSFEEEDTSLSLNVSGLSLGDDPEELTPYDVDSEQMPLHEFFSTEFQRTLQGGESIAHRTVAVLDRLTSVAGSNDTLSRLREDAQRLSSFRPADMKTIAVLGHSGEGACSSAKTKDPAS